MYGWVGIDAGIVGFPRQKHFSHTTATLETLKSRLEGVVLSPHQWLTRGLAINEDGIFRSGVEILYRSDMTVSKLRSYLPEVTADFSDRTIERLRVDAFYRSIGKYQESDMALFRREDDMLLVDNLDYDRMKFLSNEVRGRLKMVRPRSIAQLKRMEGITPDAIVRLLRYVKHCNLVPKRGPTDPDDEP